MNLGLFLPNWVGDLAMATPALRAIRRKHAGDRIVGILRPHLAEVLSGTHFLDEQIWHDPRGNHTALHTRAVVAKLRAARLDAVLLFTNSLRTALLAYASGARRRIGYARNLRGWLLTDRLHHARAGRKWLPAPVLDDYLRLAYALGCPRENPSLELATTAGDELAADTALARLGVARPMVAFNNSGAFGGAKLWPADQFADLARRVADELAHDVVLLCGPSEREVVRAIAGAANHPRVFSLAEQPSSIGLSKAIVRRSRLLVTTDSGPRHFAAAFDVPVITLFGPTHIAWSETHYRRATHLQKKLPCGPCQRRVCPLGHHQCMRDLGVDEVYQAVRNELEESWHSQAA